jgi:hypothetical protein
LSRKRLDKHELHQEQCTLGFGKMTAKAYAKAGTDANHKG